MAGVPAPVFVDRALCTAALCVLGNVACTTVDDAPAAARGTCACPELIASSQTDAKTEPETAAVAGTALSTREKLDLMDCSLPPDNSYGVCIGRRHLFLNRPREVFVTNGLGVLSRTPSAAAKLRLRLVVAMLLLALPLGVAIWAFASFAGRSSEQRADTQLATLLGSALQEYAVVLDGARSKATATAARQDVALALARENRSALARIAKAMPGVRFEPRRSPPVGTIRRPAALRSVDVVVGRRKAGRVVVGVTLDRALRERLARAIRLPAGDRLVFRPVRAREDPTDLAYKGSDYRAAGARLLGGKQTTSLFVLTPKSAIDTAGARWRVLLAGFLTLLALGVLVYGFAPGLARSRLLRQQRDQAARVLSHLGEGVFLVDEAGVILLWNPSAEAITGLPADTVRGHSAADVIPGWPEARDRIPVDEERSRATTLPIELDGRTLWLSISGVRFTGGTVYTFRDLTEERRLEQMRSDFVATVSHELRTPLASIHGAVLTISQRGHELEPALHDRLLAIVLEQSERLSALVEQILLAAQLDSGGLQVASEHFDPAHLARNVIESSRPRLPAGIEVELAAPPELPTVLGDSSRTRHVLSNLLENAIKYSPDGGRITVMVAPEGGRLCFTVRDEGLGIPRREQERIFEKFYRLDAPMSRGVGGSGLGLYICRELVRRMHGRIWVTSEPGAGSSFSFELPIAAPQSSAA
jgi:two-component system phosphate regulon sensor histidine kinase PhoR